MRESMMHRFFSLMLALLLVLSACSDDETVAPDNDFSVTVNVVDTAGEPVPGLELALWNDSALLQGKGPDKAVCKIEFNLPDTSRVRLTIEDIEGQTIRTILEQELETGSHGIYWNGLDEDGLQQSSGRYTARLQGFVSGTDEVSYDGTVDMWMALADIDAWRVDETTDERGRIVLRDMRLFPHLYERPDMMATDENGEFRGSFALTADMVFVLRDPRAGGGQRFDGQVTGRGDVVTLVWDPSRRAPATGVVGPLVADPDKGGEDPRPEWGIRSYPNPFN